MHNRKIIVADIITEFVVVIEQNDANSEKLSAESKKRE